MMTGDQSAQGAPGEGDGAGGSFGRPAEPQAVTVVVADDHPMWRDAVARDLTDAGFHVVATGMTYKQSAAHLIISHRTVQNHVQNTLGKLQLHNRVELVRYVIERGLDD